MKTMTFNNKAIAAALKSFDTLSRYHRVQLVKMGYAEAKTEKLTAGRGRPTVKYELSGKGRGLVALSKNWK